MSKTAIRNLLENGSFEKGSDFPDEWEWHVIYGRCYWTFDYDERFSGKRSIVLMQDTARSHAEFRQSVAARGRTRYRLRGRIKAGIEGRGEDCGANLYVRSLSGGKENGSLCYRPFFLGLHGWRLWSCDYVTPPGTDAVIVSFDIRNSDGAAWFDAIELFEAPEPLTRSAAPPESSAASFACGQAGQPVAKRAVSAHVFTDANADFLVNEVLGPLLGEGSVRVSSLGRRKTTCADAVFVFKKSGKRVRSGASGNLSLAELERLSRDKLVVLTPAALVQATAGDQLRLEVVRDLLVAPCARVERECLLTRGFTKGDVFPFWQAGAGGSSFSQAQLVAGGGALEGLGFEVVATSVTARALSTGRPVILWREGAGGGGLLVIDLDLANSRPDYHYHQNLAVLILSNALGHLQTSLGAFVYSDFDYDLYSGDVHALARKRPSIRLREEGSTDEGRPIYSLSIGREDAPAFFVDCGIHPYEWAPGFGALIYIARLADELERGLPWAEALLRRLRFKCVPVYAPDAYKGLSRQVRGVNLNRNFPIGWDDAEADDKGSAPLCAAETRAIADILKTERIVCAVNWHETNAGTNWVGAPGFDGRYRKYATSAPAIMRQLVDHNLFFWQASLWTQNTEPRNLHYQYMNSYPYLRDYGKGLAPYEMHYADSLGIDGLLVEQYGNSDISFAATPQRTDLTGRIIEMLFGLQIGLVCRNHGGQTREVSIPLLCGESRGEAVVFSASGQELSRKPLAVKDSAALVEVEIPAAGVLVVELDAPPWEVSGASRK